MLHYKEILILLREYLEQHTQLNFLQSNMSWIVSLFIGILTILVVTCNTKMQMKNQNKENRRPFLVIAPQGASKSVGYMVDYELSSSDKYDISTPNKRYTFYKHAQKRDIIINNIGYGIATNICIVRHEKHNQVKFGLENQVEQLSLSGGSCITINVKYNPYIHKINGQIKSYSPYLYYLFIHYQDIYENTYSLLVSIITDNYSSDSTKFYHSGTKKFKTLIRGQNIDLKQSITEYKNNI